MILAIAAVLGIIVIVVFLALLRISSSADRKIKDMDHGTRHFRRLNVRDK